MIVAAFWVGPWALLPLLAVPLFMAEPVNVGETGHVENC
jgi:hypothetical protein